MTETSQPIVTVAEDEISPLAKNNIEGLIHAIKAQRIYSDGNKDEFWKKYGDGIVGKLCCQFINDLGYYCHLCRLSLRDGQDGVGLQWASARIPEDSK